MIRKMIAWIETKIKPKQSQKMKDQVRKLELAMILKYPEPVVGPFLDHPGYTPHLAKCVAYFNTYAKTRMEHDTDRTWMVGDSIAAQARDHLRSVIPLLNMALGGMWAHHMRRIILDISLIFKSAGFVPRHIVVGTPGGNNLLNRQTPDETARQFLDVLDLLRFRFPQSRIIVYGLPFTITAYIIQSRGVIDNAVMRWVRNDKNAVLLCLVKNFVKKNRILPKPDYSSDGVHMTPLGMIEFDDDIRRGKKAMPGSLIP
jgi:hypothetical protein